MLMPLHSCYFEVFSECRYYTQHLYCKKKANIFDFNIRASSPAKVACHRPRSWQSSETTWSTKFSFEHTPNAAVRIHRISNQRSLINAPRTLCTRGRIYELIKKKRKMGTAKKGSVPRTQKGKAPIPPLQHLLHSALYNFVFERSLALPPSLTLSSPPHAKGGKGEKGGRVTRVRP